MLRCRGPCVLTQIIRKSLHVSPFVSHNNNPVLEKLLTEFTDVSYLVNTVNKDDVKDISYTEWTSRIKLLKHFGFEDSDCFKMISLYPSLLKISESNLKSTVQQWFNAELGTRNFQLVLVSQPQLLEVNEHLIRKRLPILRTYVRGVSALSQLIINSPNVMYEDWTKVCSKIHYLLNEKNFKMGDLLKSCALSKDLEFIKLRFYIAEKCGVYKQQYLMPHEENKHKKTDHNNPILKHIIQDKDENFAKFVARITLEEYIAAKDLFIDENNTENLVNEDTEDEDDDK